MAPLILTLRLDELSFHYFDGLRQRYFPPERNFLRAHLTLFHHLPNTPGIRSDIAAAAGAVPSALNLWVSGLLKLGGGVAFKIESELLAQWHRQLQHKWQPLLTRQDQQPLRPHITIQNKVHPALASTLYQQLSETFVPFAAQGLGLALHAYLGGPWQLVAYYPFRS